MNPVDHPHGGGNHQVRFFLSYKKLGFYWYMFFSTLVKLLLSPVLQSLVKKSVLLPPAGYVKSCSLYRTVSHISFSDWSATWYRQGQGSMITLLPISCYAQPLFFIFLPKFVCITRKWLQYMHHESPCFFQSWWSCLFSFESILHFPPPPLLNFNRFTEYLVFCC